MSLFFTSLNSGSNGNCYYVGNQREAVLIDAGISCRETERRMNRLGLEIKKVRAIFISHEHADHITGLVGISRKFQIPVYITESTRREAKLPLDAALVKSFSEESPITIGELAITGFRKFHDAIDPHSFVVSNGKYRVGIFTDIGSPCPRLIRNFKKCDAVFLESNYCEEMLENGKYPYFLKKRISSDHGHLSNSQALELFSSHASKKLTHLILAHLSKENNSPELVERLFKERSRYTSIVVASRYNESALYNIGVVRKVSTAQLSLF